MKIKEVRSRLKFRHYDLQTKQMRYGDIQLGCDGKPFILGKNNDIEGMKVYDIDDVITIRCTDLKDKNKNLIYENDFIKNIKTGKIYKIYEFVPLKWVLWDIETRKFDKDFDQIYDDKNIEIIGNVYKNPELIKGE